MKSPASVRDSHVSASIERFQNLAFNYNQICKNNESEDVNYLEKLLREERATFQKRKAVLQQQVELLTMQLGEASEREKQIKKNHEIILGALNQKIQEKETSIEILRIA